MSVMVRPDTPSQRGLFESLVETLYRGLTEDGLDPGIRAAQDHLIPFLRRVKPDYEPDWFHEAIGAELEHWWATPGARTILCLPPQHGKSELASRALPAWILGRAPDTRIIAASYADNLASKNNLDVQSYIDSHAYSEVFPATRLAHTGFDTSRSARAYGRAKRTATFFEVVGRRGSLRSAGIGSGIGGLPADMLIIDDPIKDRQEAESETVRSGIWQWFTSVALVRLRRPGKILAIMTRWHEDDLVGKLLESQKTPSADQWRIVRFPALAETVTPEPGETLRADLTRHESDTRADGDPLWQARFPVVELNSIRAVQTGYEWDGLYQQRPTRPGGTMFKREWFHLVDIMPATNVLGSLRCRFWDIAATADDPGACWTVGALLTRFADGKVYVEDVVRGQWGPSDVDKVIEQTTRLDGPFVMVREEREPGSSGKAVIEARARTLAGYDYKGVLSDQAKWLRWRALAAQAEAGYVHILKRAWTKSFIDELERAGPGSRGKVDQADAASGAFLEIAMKPKPSQVAQRMAGF